jgi:hypothetical protein
MAFLDFIKNRQQSAAEQTQQQKPETAKEMYSRQAEQETAGQKPVQQLPDAEKSQARELGARLDKATQHVRQDAAPETPARADSTSSPEPMRQKMMAQDEQAPALSPTSAQLGQTANEKSPSPATSEKTPEQSQQRPQTIARSTPSWER